jgi:hypothetical protein
MATKQLSEITRGDRIATPKGMMVITGCRINWEEDFSGKDAKPETRTISGLIGSKSVAFTAYTTQTVETY